jgi:hypothetical protein
MLAVGVNAFLEMLRIRLQIPFLDRIAKLVLAQASINVSFRVIVSLSSFTIRGGRVEWHSRNPRGTRTRHEDPGPESTHIQKGFSAQDFEGTLKD